MVAIEKQTILVRALDFLWLEITGKCNLMCTHCYADSSPHGTMYGNMSYSNWASTLDEASNLGCRKVQFIGGEPTLHSQLTNLIAHADQCGFQFIEVFTNATRLNPDLISCFCEHHVSVATSFYSDVPAIHESITKGKGSWHRTVAGIQRILQAGLPLRVGIIEMEQNRDGIENSIAFLHSLGVKNIRIDRQRGVGRGRLIGLDKPVEQFDELCGQCWNGKLCIVPTGEAYPCIFSRATMLGSVREGLSPILTSAKLHEFRDTVREMQERRMNLEDNHYSYQANSLQALCNPICEPFPPCQPDILCDPDYCVPNYCIPLACPPNPCAPGPSCIPKGACIPDECFPDTI